MRRIITYLLLFNLCGFASFAQVRVVKPVKTRPKHTNFGIGGGITNSMVFLTQNVKDHNSSYGYNITLTYGGTATHNLRGTLEYTHYNTLNIAPTWYGINASTIETNFHWLFKAESINTYFYPIAGLSYNMFSGYFTGRDDFLNLRAIYKPDSEASKKWLGFNGGFGAEVFIKRVSIYMEFKMRAGAADGPNKQLNIMDVCYFMGLRYNLNAPTLHQLFRGTRSRYSLSTEPVKK